MNILLDTHILLWHITDNPRLGAEQSAMIENPSNVKFISIASLWELAIKSSIGKLEISQSIESLVPQGITILDIKVSHVKLVQELTLHHKDPFDRMIIAQAIVEDFLIMTDDGNFKYYNVELI